MQHEKKAFLTSANISHSLHKLSIG